MTIKSFAPLIKDFPHFLYGGDYNPDQWLDRPDIIDEDFRLMPLAGCNCFSLPIFGWMALEPEEGVFTFDWLDGIMDRMAENGYKVNLATPSGGKPAWMAIKYPEIRRVNKQGLRDKQTGRHNHCPTSPIYREKVAIINRKLAERYHAHPALGIWHISNEYQPYCYCDLCMKAFQVWLKDRYGSLDELNQRYWSTFWANTYTSWDQITCIDPAIEGLHLDWLRFSTHQLVDFMKHEIAAIREFSKDVPTTTNFMGTDHRLDYWRFAEAIDLVSNDWYPLYHDRPNNDNTWQALTGSFIHDMNRTMKKGQPFALMETSPSSTNWQATPKLKAPGVHCLQSLQAVAHGADSVLYFQWRKGRGAHEKFHGAVVDHVGHENTRVFKEVAGVGAKLKLIESLLGSTVHPEVGLVYDWEVRWALGCSCGPRNQFTDLFDMEYNDTCFDHYAPFWKRGVSVDVIESTCDFSEYKLLILPMLFMLKPGVAERIKTYVENGGTVVTTYLSGVVDDSIRCHLGGWPGEGLREVFGIWTEEIDSLYPETEQTLVPLQESRLGLQSSYKVKEYAEIIHPEGAAIHATFGGDWYAGYPALTSHRYGKGEAYYIGARTESKLIDDLYNDLLIDLSIRRNLPGELPEGVTAQIRMNEDNEFLFLLNTSPEAQGVDLLDREYIDMLNTELCVGIITVPAYGSMVLKRKMENP